MDPKHSFLKGLQCTSFWYFPAIHDKMWPVLSTLHFLMLFGKVLDISLLEILGWFIDVNLAIVYVLTNFFIKRIVKIIAIFTIDN